ncbi:pterin-4-alpha-carbinolamine dehydratase [Aspergillus nomiae NRRL 13137]|uniref:4a-hydroxytetrahydrobiopterin dehydratase n=1 Tax=Aspergillus nomiae NRRL (strain ATCC 15546 / NRRL 13137 / CBS 260.88 / M93) TaxID=1509407 RepID=A0A0L1IZX9_ASPN3|nr:pterin-4-alpha-carbinolamine dehydratase [Aspergillus nomiae NRRL 13137]KNG85116.1 pterin-4-alpha-carbinolamine dehydratase [Aspergillus nomiae NRRL 13137]
MPQPKPPIITLDPPPSTLMQTFLSPTATPQAMQTTIHGLTAALINTAKAHDPALTNPTMVPILRGALPMFVAAAPLFTNTTCILARCSKKKGTQDVIVEWPGRRPFPPAADEGKLVVLDTLVATGDTVVALCEELWAMSSGRAERSVAVLCCYAAPEALERVAACPVVEYVVVAARAERCDEAGYLVPYTHGDIGDKIYGAAWKGAELPVVAEGEDVERVVEGVERLLVRNGGLWTLTHDGLGVEREILFPSFKKAWAFMQRVAEAAAMFRHHPEWTNVYNKVSIRWTTHQPKGLTKLDVLLAQLCDSYCEP